MPCGQRRQSTTTYNGQVNWDATNANPDQGYDGTSGSMSPRTRHRLAGQRAQQGYSVSFNRQMQQYVEAARVGQTEPLTGASSGTSSYDGTGSPRQGSPRQGSPRQGSSTSRSRSPQRRSSLRFGEMERENIIEHGLTAHLREKYFNPAQSSLRFGEMERENIIEHGPAAQLQKQYINPAQYVHSEHASTYSDGQDGQGGQCGQDGQWRRQNLTDEERERRRQRALSMPRDPTTGRFMSPRRR